MLRAKAIKFKKGEVGMGEKLLSSTDLHGSFAGIPIVSQLVNAVNHTKPARAVMEKVLGVDKDAWLPDLAAKKFRSGAVVSKEHFVVDGAKTPGKVAIYATCHINYNEPGIGHDLLKILDHNEVPYVLVEKESCCGMPKLELGDLDSVGKSKDANIPTLAKYAKDGFAILSAVPSCTLMFKQEIPLMFPGDTDVALVKEAMWDPVEYLMARKRDGLRKVDFPVELGKISYQIPCHGRVQQIGKKTEEMLKMVPGTSVHTHERCSGHAGTFGVKVGTHDQAMKIGKPLFKAMANHKDGGLPDVISSDCPLGGHHIAPLVPDGGNWKATMLIEYPDENERRRELARLIGVADHMFVEVEGHTRVYAIADEDLERENDEKTSAVHFVRFELNAAMRAAVLAGAGVKLGCDHTNYPAHTQIEPEALTSLASDLKL